jgi:hypothetical protein
VDSCDLRACFIGSKVEFSDDNQRLDLVSTTASSSSSLGTTAGAGVEVFVCDTDGDFCDTEIQQIYQFNKYHSHQ